MLLLAACAIFSPPDEDDDDDCIGDEPDEADRRWEGETAPSVIVEDFMDGGRVSDASIEFWYDVYPSGSRAAGARWRRGAARVSGVRGGSLDVHRPGRISTVPSSRRERRSRRSGGRSRYWRSRSSASRPAAASPTPACRWYPSCAALRAGRFGSGVPPLSTVGLGATRARRRGEKIGASGAPWRLRCGPHGDMVRLADAPRPVRPVRPRL